MTLKIERVLTHWAWDWGHWALPLGRRVSGKHFFAVLLKKDRIDLVALFNRAPVTESITLICKKDRRERFDLFHDQIDLSIT